MVLLSGRALAAQAVLSGRVIGPAGEPVTAAALMLHRATDSLQVAGTDSDTLGRFVFDTVPAGRYVIRAQRIGYLPAQRGVVIGTGPVALELVLAEAPVALEAVTVEGERTRARFETEAGATVRELSRNELKLIPGLAEADVLRAIEVLPGVVTTSDFSSSFNVRGGSADQNLIQLDGIPIYNPFHVGGLFSVFNSDMIERAELLAGGFPAEYGGRVSSVLNVISDAGVAGTQVSGGVSVLATRLSVGADLPKSGRIRVGARRSYFDQLLKPFFEFPYYLHDFQLTGAVWTSPASRLSVTAYLGDDVLNFAGVDSFPLQLDWKWGNRVGGAAWTRTFANGGALDVRASYSRFVTRILFPDFSDTRFASRMQHALVRGGLVLPAGAGEFKAGVELNRLWYANSADAGGATFRQSDGRAWQPSGYAQLAWKPSQNWLVETGARVDVHATRGIHTITQISPRLAVKRFVLDGSAAVKLAAGRFTQFVHSLRDEELPVGIDLWVITDERAPAVISDQLQAGFEWLPRNGWYAAVETYIRDFDGVVTNNFADDPNDARDDLLAGTGRSYGADLIVRRDDGPVRGFVTASWLRAWREFPDFLSGLDPAPLVRYAPLFDRRAEIDLVLSFDLPKRWEGGLRWNFGTGLPYTRPLGSFVYHEYALNRGRRAFEDGDSSAVAVVLGERNSSRYPAYHRLDVSFRKLFRKSWGTLTPHIDILNVYNRKNVLFYFYDFNTNPATRGGTSMFPLLPTVGVEVVF